MFKYIKFFFRGGYKIILSYPKIRRYFKNKDKYSFEERYAFARKLIVCFIKAFNVKINASGFEKIDLNKTYLFVSNHQAVMDALSLIYLLDKPMTFVCKIEVKKYPFVGKVCDMIDVIFIDRNNIRDAVKMVKTSREYLKKGLNVAIYPEGTRTKDDNYMPGEYKAGAFKPAYEAESSLANITIDGSYKVFSSKYKKDLIINISASDVYDYDEYCNENTNQLAEQFKASTCATLEEFRKQ